MPHLFDFLQTEPNNIDIAGLLRLDLIYKNLYKMGAEHMVILIIVYRFLSTDSNCAKNAFCKNRLWLSLTFSSGQSWEL